jgi:hypothetical protein
MASTPSLTDTDAGWENWIGMQVDERIIGYCALPPPPPPTAQTTPWPAKQERIII